MNPVKTKSNSYFNHTTPDSFGTANEIPFGAQVNRKQSSPQFFSYGELSYGEKLAHGLERLPDNRLARVQESAMVGKH